MINNAGDRKVFRFYYPRLYLPSSWAEISLAQMFIFIVLIDLLVVANLLDISILISIYAYTL